MGKLGPRAKKIRAVSSCVESSDKDCDVFAVFSGVRRLSDKCRKGLPGRPDTRRNRQTEYSQLMMTKQAIKRYYGVAEKPFKNAYIRASKMRGSAADNLMEILENRLDNVVYHSGMACTRREAKQLVSHGHIMVNGKRVNVSSIQIALGDVISVTEKAKKHARIASSLTLADQRDACSWMEVDRTKLTIKITKSPDLEPLHALFKVNRVIELYSK